MQVQDNKIDIIRKALPKEGLFAEKDWLLSPDAFPIEKTFLSEVEQLGHRLFIFQRACISSISSALAESSRSGSRVTSTPENRKS